ncbi:sigma-70 family RNA polymerase sigma factor [bacterium]|nr:sigma-70 family RNA polymerase sigma factor [bacterium]
METSNNFLDFLRRCSLREKDAWDLFVERYSNLIYNYIIRTLKKYYYFFQNDEVDDIFNRIIVALLDRNCRRLKNFRGENERSFGAYLREICFHITVDFLREQKDFVELEQIQYRICDDDKSERFDDKELKDIIEILRDKLPERHKLLFTLIYKEGLDLDEIADMMDLKLNALHQLKFRMLSNLAKIAKKMDLYNDLKSFISDS